MAPLKTNLELALSNMRGTDAPKVLRDLMLRGCGYKVDSLAITDRLGKDPLGTIYEGMRRAGWLNSDSLAGVINQTLQHLAVVQPKITPAHRAFVRLEPAKDFKPGAIIHNLSGIEVAAVAEGAEIPDSAVELTIDQTDGLTTYAVIASLSREAIFNSAGSVLPGLINALVNAAYKAERDLIVTLLNSASVTPVSGGLTNLAGLLEAWHNSSVLAPKYIACNPSAQLVLASEIKAAGLDISVVALKGLINTFMLPAREMSPVVLLTLPEADAPTVDTASKFSGDSTRMRVRHDIEPVLLLNDDIACAGV